MEPSLDLEKGLRPASSNESMASSKSSPSTTPKVSTLSVVSPSALPQRPAPRPVAAVSSSSSSETNRISRFLQHHYTAYRKIFTVIFVANLAVLVALVVLAQGSPSSTSAGDAAAVNLAVGVLFRQEQVVNTLFWVLTSAPPSWPLCIRVQLAKVFHYGGFHSGCGVAAAVWFVLYTVLVTKEYVQSASIGAAPSTESLSTAWLLLALFAVLLGGAYPAIRIRFHNHFEAAHRFAGWAALAAFWAHVLFTAHAAAPGSGSMGRAIVASVPFWCILVATLPVVLSWAQLRRRVVRVEPLSAHATRLRFDYAALPPCYGVRVSTNPLLEWHSFATIPDTDAEEEHAASGVVARVSGATALAPPRGFSLVVSNAGDWTRTVIGSPPPTLWVRGSPLRGVIFSARLFTRVVVVATGSGIGPCLSLLVAQAALLPNPPRVLWSAPSPERTFGSRLMASVRRADANAIIWDTREKGRPDLCALAEGMARESGAEAVFVISNPKVCRMMVNGMGDRGWPCYAPIFDS